MKLQEIIEAQPGTLIKGFQSIRVEYMDRIKANITTPSFEGWQMSEKTTRQSFGYNLVKDFKCEEELILVNRRIQAIKDSLVILTDKNNMNLNSEILEDEGWSLAKTSELVRITTEETPGMLLGDYFSTSGDSVTPTPDNFFGKLYAKILVGDKIGWLCFCMLSDDYHLEIE